jgi:hypothetical protein
MAHTSGATEQGMHWVVPGLVGTPLKAPESIDIPHHSMVFVVVSSCFIPMVTMITKRFFCGFMKRRDS